jgi:hypothetical protein
MRRTENTRYMKRIVGLCLTTLILMFIASYFLACMGVDTNTILTLGCSVFGGELLLTVILKLIEKDSPASKATKSKEVSKNG